MPCFRGAGEEMDNETERLDYDILSAMIFIEIFMDRNN
jgi:hypothetical protein